MGALNHSQYLYKSRPWEQKCILYFDIFNIEMSHLKIDVRNLDIIKVSPLMIDGYRFWLNNITRYSYNFYNFKITNKICLKINNLKSLNFCWNKLNIFLQYFLFLSLLNTKYIIIFFLIKLYKLKFNLKKIKLTYFLNLFFVDNSDILSIKFLNLFSKKVLGYSNILLNKTKQLPIKYINSIVKNFYLKKENVNEYINLDFNINKIINFQILNLKKIIHINNFNYKIIIKLILNCFIKAKFKIFLKQINLNLISINQTNKFINFFNYFFNILILKQKNLNFFINYNNIFKLNFNKLINKKSGNIFFNNLFAYNLHFIGYINKFKNNKNNFIFNEFILLFDNTSYINWFKYKNYKKLIKKYFIINFNINPLELLSLNIPIDNILNTKKSLYINSFGKIIINNAIFISKNYKNYNFIFKNLIKNIKKINKK